MWIVANGAPKTGSTWVLQLLQLTNCFHPIPPELQNSEWSNWSIRDNIAQEYAAVLAGSRMRYLSKQHWGRENRELLGIDGLKIINSIRDIRDTIVSRYYHDTRVLGLSKGIEDYLATKAEPLVRQFCEYQRYWLDVAFGHPQSYYICSYERLSHNSEVAAGDLFDFCRLDLSRETLVRVVKRTRFDKKKVRGPGRFFRKGKVHSFADDLTSRDADRIIRLATQFGLPAIKHDIAKFSPVLGEYLKMTDVGIA